MESGSYSDQIFDGQGLKMASRDFHHAPIIFRDRLCPLIRGRNKIDYSQIGGVRRSAATRRVAGQRSIVGTFLTSGGAARV